MVIKKRNITAERSPTKGRLRHPLLKFGTTTLLVYNFIRDNPNCRSRDFAHLTSSRQPVTNLVNEGLVRVTSEVKPFHYEVVPENETGRKRDKVLLHVTISANKYGEYSATCELIGQKPLAHLDFPQLVAFREFEVTIPHPEDPYAIRPMVDVNERVDTTPPSVYTPHEGGDLTIDVDFEIIPPDK